MNPISALPKERSDVAALRKLLDAAAHVVPSSRRCELRGPKGETIGLPESVFYLLKQVVDVMAQGDAITIVPVGRELTTQQAADLPNMSRQYLVRVLGEGKIPFRRTGKLFLSLRSAIRAWMSASAFSGWASRIRFRTRWVQYGHEVLGLKETEHVATPTDQRSINFRPPLADDSIAELAVIRSSGQRTRKVERFCRKCVAQARLELTQPGFRFLGRLHLGIHWFVMRMLSTTPLRVALFRVGSAERSPAETHDFSWHL